MPALCSQWALDPYLASHVVIARYREQFDRRVTLPTRFPSLARKKCTEALDKLLLTFVEHFPETLAVIRGQQTPAAMVAGLD